MRTVVIYGRDGCCLCEQALQLLEQVRATRPFALQQRDIESDQRLLNSILMREDEGLTTELIRGAIDALRRRRLERQQREIKSRIADAEKRQELQGLPALLQEKVKIDRELATIGQQ